VEVKFQDAPRLTPSMRIALTDLGLGDVRYDLDRRVTVVPLAQLASGKVEMVTTGPTRRKRRRVT
jgi:hypothetical protein